MHDDIFNGMPSIILKQRPFYSIIIPCYNSKKTLGVLLDSIIAQDMNDEIEVVLADDCSTESYQDVVDKYKDILSIRQIKTDYNFAPGNTREKGVSIAEGEWICFADHDDEFIPESLKKIKNIIVSNNEDKFIMADFNEVNPETREIIKEYKYDKNLLHAKFFNLDNFWKKYDLHFIKDLRTHEDICLMSQAYCASLASKKPPLYINEVIYCWMVRDDSLSRKRYQDESFIEIFFKDYIESTGYTYIDCFYKYNLDYELTLLSALEVLVYCYFYIQGIKFNNCYNFVDKNEEYAKKYLITIKEMFNISNQEIIDIASRYEADMYIDVRKSANLYVGTFIESDTFLQFLNRLHEDAPIRETMSQVMRKENL